MTTTVRAAPSTPFVRPPLHEAERCTLVIFGATGDLTRRKLLPALYELQCAGGMSNCCEIIGIGRTPLTNEQFRLRVREAFAELKDSVDTNDSRWQAFDQRLRYIPGDPNDPSFYSRLPPNSMRRDTPAQTRTACSTSRHLRRSLGRS